MRYSDLFEETSDQLSLSRLLALARDASSLEEFLKAIDTRVAGTSYRAGNLEDAIALRKDSGSLAGYDARNQAEWFGHRTEYATPVPKNGKAMVFRATPNQSPIMPGDYVTQSLLYAQLHIDSNLGSGVIARMKVSLDDLFPADGPSEFWYAPSWLDGYSSVEDFFEKAKRSAE